MDGGQNKGCSCFIAHLFRRYRLKDDRVENLRIPQNLRAHMRATEAKHYQTILSEGIGRVRCPIQYYNSLYSFKMFGPLGISFAPAVRSSKTLTRWIKPFANWYANVSGYRRMGLRYDDLRE